MRVARDRGGPESRNEINEALRENDDDMAAGIVRNAEVNNEGWRGNGTHPEPTAVCASRFLGTNMSNVVKVYERPSRNIVKL